METLSLLRKHTKYLGGWVEEGVGSPHDTRRVIPPRLNYIETGGAADPHHRTLTNS